jgi:hypothetical protein
LSARVYGTVCKCCRDDGAGASVNVVVRGASQTGVSIGVVGLAVVDDRGLDTDAGVTEIVEAGVAISAVVSLRGIVRCAVADSDVLDASAGRPEVVAVLTGSAGIGIDLVGQAVENGTGGADGNRVSTSGQVKAIVAERALEAAALEGRSSIRSAVSNCGEAGTAIRGKDKAGCASGTDVSSNCDGLAVGNIGGDGAVDASVALEVESVIASNASGGGGGARIGHAISDDAIGNAGVAAQVVPSLTGGTGNQGGIRHAAEDDWQRVGDAVTVLEEKAGPTVCAVAEGAEGQAVGDDCLLANGRVVPSVDGRREGHEDVGVHPGRRLHVNKVKVRVLDEPCVAASATEVVVGHAVAGGRESDTGRAIRVGDIPTRTAGAEVGSAVHLAVGDGGVDGRTLTSSNEEAAGAGNAELGGIVLAAVGSEGTVGYGNAPLRVEVQVEVAVAEDAGAIEGQDVAVGLGAQGAGVAIDVVVVGDVTKQTLVEVVALETSNRALLDGQAGEEDGEQELRRHRFIKFERED